MKKSHRVAHENQRRGGFCYYHYTALNLIVKNSFSKEYKKFSKQDSHTTFFDNEEGIIFVITRRTTLRLLRLCYRENRPVKHAVN